MTNTFDRFREIKRLKGIAGDYEKENDEQFSQKQDKF